jgi:hypothetical protein
MADTYKLVVNKPGYYQFTMPDGFSSNVEVHTWGAGGGAGSGAPGGGGGYATSNVVIQTGNVVSIVVGLHGGDASGASAGAAGTGASIGYNGGSGASQGDPEDGDAGGSGGGGGATAVLSNGSAVAVAAGGGGGGGYGEDGAGGATAGYPGGIFVGQSSGFYQATHPRYCGFLNTYGVWGPFSTTVTINFPVSDTYTFYFSVDNYGSVVLDNSITLFSVSGEFNYGTYYTTTQTVSAGNHTLTINPVNISGPASVGVQILNPSSVDIWNTLALLVDTGLTGTTNGQNGTRGGAGGSGGGGGGLLGGETGVAYGDDAPGGQGGNGGQNYGDITIAGTDQTSGGADKRSALGVPPSTGNAGYDGYAILVFTKKLKLYNKISNGNIKVSFSGNITAAVGKYITQTSSGANAVVIAGNITANTLALSYKNANVFTLTSGNISTSPWTGNARISGGGGDANVYPLSTSGLGDWKNIDKVYWKATRAGTLSNVNTKTFTTIGDNTFVIPDLVKQLTVSYPTPSGMATKLFPVTAGETITVSIGDFGVATVLKGKSGTLSLPAFDTQVFFYHGNVDHIIAQNVQVATDTPTSYTGSGSNATLEAGAAAAGITYTVTYEGWHGDLGASISITPVLKSTIYQPVQVYVAGGAGRQFPSAHTYQQQPSADNGYIMNDYQGDYYGGEGGYSWTTNLQQQGYVSISYDQSYLQGTWIPVSQIYYKDASWKPLVTNATISLTKLP